MLPDCCLIRESLDVSCLAQTPKTALMKRLLGQRQLEVLGSRSNGVLPKGLGQKAPSSEQAKLESRDSASGTGLLHGYVDISTIVAILHLSNAKTPPSTLRWSSLSALKISWR